MHDPTDSTDPTIQTRRRVLQLTTTTALAGLAAGCLGGNSSGGGNGDGETSMDDGMTGTTDDGMTEDEMTDDGMTEDEMTDDGMTDTTDGEMDDGMDDTTDDGMDGDDETTDGEMDGDMAGHHLTLSIPDLPELAEGHYEGWAVFGSETASTGTFSAGDDLSFSVDRDLREADEIAVTIEPHHDMADGPSDVVFLSGTVEDGTASLAFPVDFGDASGSYILATPSTETTDDETSGIWFLDPTGGAKTASLDLPDLPSGWVYEGWAVADGTPLSSGRFRDPAGPDDASEHQGPGDYPPFPGEDFVRNPPMGVEFPLDLANGGGRVVVSVEPDVDGTDPTGPTPFAIKPLAGGVPKGATDHANYDLTRDGDATPSGSAEIR